MTEHKRHGSDWRHLQRPTRPSIRGLDPLTELVTDIRILTKDCWMAGDTLDMQRVRGLGQMKYDETRVIKAELHHPLEDLLQGTQFLQANIRDILKVSRPYMKRRVACQQK